jgi:hypothetical protein
MGPAGAGTGVVSRLGQECERAAEQGCDRLADMGEWGCDYA